MDKAAIHTKSFDDYNANPSINKVNKLIKMIKEKMSKPEVKKFGKKLLII